MFIHVESVSLLSHGFIHSFTGKHRIGGFQSDLNSQLGEPGFAAGFQRVLSLYHLASGMSECFKSAYLTPRKVDP